MMAVPAATYAPEQASREQYGVAPAVEPGVVPAVEPAVVAEPPMSARSFAPPTSEMTADAVYAQAASRVEVVADAEITVSDDEPVAPVTRIASVVFVDEDPDGGGSERTSALRRLIGSLRRK